MEHWRTLDEIIAARTRIIASLSGWERPAANGIGFVPLGEEPHPQPQHRQVPLQATAQSLDVRAQRRVGCRAGDARKRLRRGASGPGRQLNGPQKQPPSTVFQTGVVTAVFLA